MVSTTGRIFIGLFLLATLVLAGCVKSVEEVKSDDYVGKTVSVKGTAQGVTKIGALSGYFLEDANGDVIPVSSSDLPEEGATVVAKGVLMKEIIIGYYILEK